MYHIYRPNLHNSTCEHIKIQAHLSTLLYCNLLNIYTNTAKFLPLMCYNAQKGIVQSELAYCKTWNTGILHRFPVFDVYSKPSRTKVINLSVSCTHMADCCRSDRSAKAHIKIML